MILRYIFLNKYWVDFWWKYFPGVKFRVKWPAGLVVFQGYVRHWHPGLWPQERIFSSDPNDHYRLELEKLVGIQGWDWNWRLEGNDGAENRLTIKIRNPKKAAYFILKWG